MYYDTTNNAGAVATSGAFTQHELEAQAASSHIARARVMVESFAAGATTHSHSVTGFPQLRPRGQQQQLMSGNSRLVQAPNNAECNIMGCVATTGAEQTMIFRPPTSAHDGMRAITSVRMYSNDEYRSKSLSRVKPMHACT